MKISSCFYFALLCLSMQISLGMDHHGIESVGIFKKEEKEVCILTQEAAQQVDGESQLFSHFLDRIASLPNAPTCIFLLDKRLLRQGLKNEGALESLSRDRIKDHFNVLIYLALKNPMYKNMRFILKQDKHLYQFQLTVFSNKLPDIFRYVKSEFHIPLSDEQYDKTLHNRAARVEHLKPGGVFANICSLASQSIERTLQQLDDKPCTTGEYLAYYDAQVAELETAGKRFPLLKEVIARHLKESSLARAKLKEFFDEYGAGPNDSLLAPQFKALSQGTILETYHKIKAATMPCAVTIEFT